MRFILFLAALFAAFAGYNLVSADTANGVAGLAIAAVLWGIYTVFHRQEQEAEEFLTWLVEHAGELRGAELSYRGHRVSEDTELVRFQAAFSLILVTFRLPSRFFIRGEEPTAVTALTYTLLSLIFGWWGIPWGPVYTVQSVYRNLRGGQRMRVREIFADEPLPETAGQAEPALP